METETHLVGSKEIVITYPSVMSMGEKQRLAKLNDALPNNVSAAFGITRKLPPEDRQTLGEDILAFRYNSGLNKGFMWINAEAVEKWELTQSQLDEVITSRSKRQLFPVDLVL